MDFIKAQLTKIPPVACANLSNSTVLVTGANAGLGLEVAREFLLSTPKRLILAVRDVDKGIAAKQELERGNIGSTAIEVRKLDQASFKSVTAFVASLEGEPVEIAVLNAGVWNTNFSQTEDGLEADLQVNTVAPSLLSILLLPNLRLASKASASTDGIRPRLTFVSSGLHEMAKFPERKYGPGKILAALNDPSKYAQQDRYPVSKTIGLFWTRELARRVSDSEVVVNAVAPGFCKTGLLRNTSGFTYYASKLAESLLGRSPQEGARCIVDAATAKGPESHGLYLSECNVKGESKLVRGVEGRNLQTILWNDTVDLLKEHGLDKKALAGL